MASAARVNSSMIWRNSTGLDLRKFLRAGTLKNRFLTAMLVPMDAAIFSCFFTSLPSIKIRVPRESSSRLVFNSTCATEAILAKASPLKPMVFILKISSLLDILEVACRSQHIRASVGLMPMPLSITCTKALPASRKINLISVLWASMALSSNSFTTLAGL